MKQHKRSRIPATAALVNEMNGVTEDLGSEVWKAVDGFFRVAPIVLCCPVLADRTELFWRRAMGPGRIECGYCVPRVRFHTGVNAFQLLLGYGDLEWCWSRRHFVSTVQLKGHGVGKRGFADNVGTINACGSIVKVTSYPCTYGVAPHCSRL